MTEPDAAPLTAEEESDVRATHTEPHGCKGIDPIMGRGSRAFGLAQDGVACDAARLLATLDAIRSGSPEDDVLDEHTPWARAEFARHRLWMACSCGWNADGARDGTWNAHFRAVSPAHELTADEANRLADDMFGTP